MKRFVYILLAVVILAAAVLFSGCNKTVADLTYKYNYAWIELPGGDVVEGPVQSWTEILEQRRCFLPWQTTTATF